MSHVSTHGTAHGDRFADRHIGTTAADHRQMLDTLGYRSLDDLVDALVPASILDRESLRLPTARSEVEAIEDLRSIAGTNATTVDLIGQGYSGTVTPPVILRNVLENPAWYTAYTPYQPEISQGRLEALVNFQTMVADICGLDIANASMLDEGTAAAEAMAIAWRTTSSDSKRFLVDRHCHPQTIDVVSTRAEPLGIELLVAEPDDPDARSCFGALIANPRTGGELIDLEPLVTPLREAGVFVVAVTDLLACCIAEPPGSAGVDAAVGSSQRFGVPMGGGGPHAGFLAVRDRYKRALPGRLVGVSVDSEGRTAYRLALQTREQHIRREKATSNICTAQVLLAVMASMYAVYHGPDGLRRIARRVASLSATLAAALRAASIDVLTEAHFDTISVRVDDAAEVLESARRQGLNLRRIDERTVGISVDETTTLQILERVVESFGIATSGIEEPSNGSTAIPERLIRRAGLLEHPTFHRYHSETEMLRYLRTLADRDIALDRAMIPLGSCTMKLNATSEMIPVSWPAFADQHPFAPADQRSGTDTLVADLERWLAEITGYDAVSLQPNAGSQGELAGLLAIRAFHRSRGDEERDVCLIPSSAHGTNAASAVMAGMRVVVVGCDDYGNVDLVDLAGKAAEHAERLAALMVTYPSTHGVFEDGIVEICDLVHQHGGQVYVDGANLNALVGLARPGRFGADVSHLNLHKTFCIPHGGGGPGVGPVAVKAHLAPFLPSHPRSAEGDGPPAGTAAGVGPVAAAPFGSAGILPITWMYIAMMGPDGLRDSTLSAILAANYVAHRLSARYDVLYTGGNGLVAHECIIDIRPIERASGISAEDIAKRLIDYGFHAPTMSFPVPGTLMIEPTESESLAELDRFCSTMLAIRDEIDRVELGEWPRDDNPLVGAPHTAEDLLSDAWTRAYTREQAAFPLAGLRQQKYWPPVSRIDGGYGDRNLVCSCPPVEAFATD